MSKQLTYIFLLTLFFVFIQCQNKKEPVIIKKEYVYLNFSKNILDYTITPTSIRDRNGLMFSDQGAWFAYSLPSKETNSGGFSGPFLMTQQNGVWLSDISAKWTLKNKDNNSIVNWIKERKDVTSYSSNLEQIHSNTQFEITQKLCFFSGHTALQQIRIKNISDQKQIIKQRLHGQLNNIGIKVALKNNSVTFNSEKSTTTGYLKVLNDNTTPTVVNDSTYSITIEDYALKPGETRTITLSQTFIFPEYSWEKEQQLIQEANFDKILEQRKQEKNNEIKALVTQKKEAFNDPIYNEVLAKAQLTLQNNWRIPAGEIKHEGLFPSYHYVWFNGFWSWDSWKHSVGLANYNLPLAKKQVKLMFEFQNEDGFVADCVYRDTTIERHNYRDTKPPLSAWAVTNIYKKDNDLDFVKELYPKLKKYHYWWYQKRDHDQDGLCEYGSTDGSLIAAKWESGMDNAIRFDNAKILKNEEGAYSINQESVDLNAYLYAEKLFLIELAKALGLDKESQSYKTEADFLKSKIQTQFFDKNDGWFYDTDLSGRTFIKGEGSEGWTALWAKAATTEQAQTVKTRMMDQEKFYTKVPFQTMSADHDNFNPLKGYWRGPNWLDQAYFGVKALRNYGFHTEANQATIQILKGAEGILEKGKSIRENYHPITGKGLNAQNFSWSAAHIIMLLTDSNYELH